MQRIIIKIGSSSIVSSMMVNYEKMEILMKNINELKNRGIDVLLVSSGAIACGMMRLNIKKKPNKLPLKQACAALGQVSLMNEYEKIANKYGILCAQILVNHDDFNEKNRMNHLTNTINTLFSQNVLPIVNENDALSVEEIKVGDNDTLAALFVPMIEADMLILISDIDGLFDKNPKEHPDAKLISVVDEIDEDIFKIAKDATSSVGTGGMKTKIKAAQITTTAGATMVIMNINRLDDLIKVVNGDSIGTKFIPNKKFKLKDHWLIYKAYAKGEIIIDDGAEKALDERKSLLPKGIKEVNGDFLKGSVVMVKNLSKKIIAKGITNYSSKEIDLIKGVSTDEIEKILKRKDKDEVIHANCMVIISSDIYGDIR